MLQTGQYLRFIVPCHGQTKRIDDDPRTNDTSMLTGSELILATKKYAKDFPLKSWWSILSTITLLGAAVAGTLLEISPLARLACSVLSGLLLLRLFVIYHDQQHHAILSGSRLAEGLMAVFGVLALSPTSIW